MLALSSKNMQATVEYSRFILSPVTSELSTEAYRNPNFNNLLDQNPYSFKISLTKSRIK